MVPTETIDSDDDEFDNPKTKQEAPKKISSTTKPKKANKRRPPSEDERASDNEYVPSGNDNSDDDSNASDDNASEDEKPGPSRKRSAAPKQPAKKPRGRPSKAGGGGGASLLCQPCPQPDEDAELIVDAAWYGSAKDVWGDAGEFVTELVMSLARQPSAPDICRLSSESPRTSATEALQGLWPPRVPPQRTSARSVEARRGLQGAPWTALKVEEMPR